MCPGLLQNHSVSLNVGVFPTSKLNRRKELKISSFSRGYEYSWAQVYVCQRPLYSYVCVFLYIYRDLTEIQWNEFPAFHVTWLSYVMPWHCHFRCRSLQVTAHSIHHQCNLLLSRSTLRWYVDARGAPVLILRPSLSILRLFWRHFNSIVKTKGDSSLKELSNKWTEAKELTKQATWPNSNYDWLLKIIMDK